MKIRFIFWFILVGISIPFSSLIAGEIVLKGIYKGTNLYIQNPRVGDGFCIQGISINDQPLKDIPQASAFELKIASFAKSGEFVEIKIQHSDECKPKVLNPNVLREKTHFRFLNVQIQGDSIRWSVEGEEMKGIYFVMEFEHNKWVNNVTSQGRAKGNHTYFKEIHHHSGVNRYKIKFQTVNGIIYMSPEVKHTAIHEQVTFSPKRVRSSITLSKSVPYTIMDSHGHKVTEGKGDKIDCAAIPSGLYYLNFDNRTEQFIKK